MRKRRRQHKRIKIAAGILLLLGIMTAGSMAVVKVLSLPEEQKQSSQEEKKGPDELLKTWYSHIENKEYEAMYQMLDEESRENLTSEKFITRNKNIYEGIEAENIQLKVTRTKYEGKSAVVFYEVKMDTLAGEISFENQTVFRMCEQDSQEYKLSWDDSMIFPELSSADKVKVIKQEAKRGSILDRNGNTLAGQGVASSVGLVPGKMSEAPKKDMEKLAELLGVSVESIEKKLSAGWVKEDSFVPVKTIKKLTELEEMSEYTDEETSRRIEQKKALLEIPGVMMTDTEIREYPLGASASHLVGYIQKVNAEDLEEHAGEGYTENSVIGRSGIEGLFEKELKGQNGCEIVITSTEGTVKYTLASISKRDGEDIRLTIDSELQKNLYENFAEDKSCSVAMNPYTGEVLALVSTPSFDSNDFIYGMSEELWQSLNEDNRNPFYNRFRQKVCPGSSFKPVIAAIGLQTGAINPAEDYGKEGLSWQKDKSWGNYYVTTLHEYEPVTLENAIIYSDNIYFAKAALKIGKEELQTQLDALGFGSQLPFEISVESSQYANNDEIESEIQLADSGYGQGQVLVNPIHLAALYSGFVNEGNVLKPYLLYRENAQAEVWLKEAYTPQAASQVKHAMEQVISSPNGTGHRAYREDIALAGKTGTAELKVSKEDQNGTELGWFGIFTSDPQVSKPVLIISMVEDVKERGGSGYVVAKEKEVLAAWFGSENQ